MEWLLAGLGLLSLTLYCVRLVGRVRKAAATLWGDDAVDATPFCEEQYTVNSAASQDYDLQQALRRAGRLAHRGKTAEAVAVLLGVRNAVTDLAARQVLDHEIRRLGGAPPAPPKPAASAQPPAHDPHADRLRD